MASGAASMGGLDATGLRPKVIAVVLGLHGGAIWWSLPATPALLMPEPVSVVLEREDIVPEQPPAPEPVVNVPDMPAVAPPEFEPAVKLPEPPPPVETMPEPTPDPVLELPPVPEPAVIAPELPVIAAPPAAPQEMPRVVVPPLKPPPVRRVEPPKPQPVRREPPKREPERPVVRAEPRAKPVQETRVPPARAAAPSASPRASGGGNEAGYAARVRATLQARANALGLEDVNATAGLAFTIDASGRVASSSVTRSSGDFKVDAALRRMVASSSFPPPPNGRFSGSVTVRIH